MPAYTLSIEDHHWVERYREIRDAVAVEIEIQTATTGKRNHRKARANAQVMLARPDIKGWIEEQDRRMLERMGVAEDFILSELGRIAFANVKDLYDQHGRLHSIHSLPPEVTSAISQVREKCVGVEKDGTLRLEREYKLYDKVKALELLGKHFKMWTDRVEVADDYDTLVRRARERVKRLRKIERQIDKPAG